MKARPPACRTVIPWLKANLGPKCLAKLTGTDAKALAAAVMIVELFAHHNRAEVLSAFRGVVRCMQWECRPLAYHAIAHILDWSDRERLWGLAMLEPLSAKEAGWCAFEPAMRAQPQHQPQPA